VAGAGVVPLKSSKKLNVDAGCALLCVDEALWLFELAGVLLNSAKRSADMACYLILYGEVEEWCTRLARNERLR
jgi:hypothetical protein